MHYIIKDCLYIYYNAPFCIYLCTVFEFMQSINIYQMINSYT